MKRTVSTFASAAAAALITGSSHANTLAWFHFDEQDPGHVFSSVGPGVVTNECNAATPVYSYATTGKASGATPAAYMPRYATPHYGLRLKDPVSGRTWNNRSSMRFVTGTESGKGGSYYGGTLMVPGSDKSFQPTDAITVECFVCTTGGVFNTFSPIFGKRNSGDYANESWALYMTSSGKLAARLNMKVSGASPDYGQGVAINDGKWHHVAMTYDKTDGVCRVYVDYAQSFTFSPAGGGAISYLDSSEYTNFHIGGYPFVSNGSNIGRKFDGCIDELRVSDVALQPSQFLRFEPADPDELVHISFDQHSYYGTAISTSANYNYRPDIVAKFERVGGSAAIDRATKCASKVRGGVFEPQVANDGSYRSEVDGSGKSGQLKIAGFTKYMAGGIFETNRDYTVEAYFRTRTASTSGSKQTVFMIGNKTAGACLFYQEDGRVRFMYNNNSTLSTKYSDATSACDGGWHHVAIVNDSVRRQMRFYFDKRLTASANGVNNVIQSNSSLYVGSDSNGSEDFDGWIDEVRVTNRALSPDEFVSIHMLDDVDASDPTVAYMNFENSYATTPYPALVAAGAGYAHSSQGVAPEFSRLSRLYVMDGANGTDKVDESSCLGFADSMAGWPYSLLFEQEAFTVEFFANIEELRGGANVIRYAGGTSNFASTPVWALYRDTSHDDTLCLRIQLVTNGVSSASYDAKWSFAPALADSRWHHYALTLRPGSASTTVVEMFRDYASLGSRTLQGRLDYTVGFGGRLALGAGSDANKVFGRYDALRFSKGVLPPAKFISKGFRGAMIVVR
ncbi:MAG: LamG domain-containing protein [Kiritimatiellae bacterium]|nr:LamG domain-containing protein [Kiritimatiellia bacterium]